MDGTLGAQASWERQVILMIDMSIEAIIFSDIHTRIYMATCADFDIRLHRRVVDHLKWSTKIEELD